MQRNQKIGIKIELNLRDDDMDGDWEAPKIPNPDFKGEWQPKVFLMY